MKLKNVLIVVNDIERSKQFYKTIFGLDVILDSEGNVILTEGLVLQDASIWKTALNTEISSHNNATVLYFEETDIDGFIEKLENYYQENVIPVQYITPITKLPWGQKMLRFYDPDGNLIEVRTPA